MFLLSELVNEIVSGNGPEYCNCILSTVKHGTLLPAQPFLCVAQARDRSQ